MIIVGIDPGTAKLGYGVVSVEDPLRLIEYGVLQTPAKTEMALRLLSIYEGLAAILDEFKPQRLAIEQLFFARNVTTGITVGQARGVAILAAAQRGIEVTEFTPAEVKQSVVGYGKADKHQIQMMVQMILALEEPPEPDDAADALAVAICQAHHMTGLSALVDASE